MFPPSQKSPTSVGIGQVDFRSMDLGALALVNPQIALARAKGVDFAPYLLNITGTFSDSTLTTNPVSFQNGNTSITQPSVCDQIVYEIDAPNSFAGSIWKSQNDYFYQLQSGIQATLSVQGAPRYTISPYFTPLRSLLASLSEGWPAGWFLNYNQSVVMQFQQTFGLQSTPTTITCTFRLWQPVGTDEFQMLSAPDARAQLKAMGVPTQFTGPSGSGT
jgi:hypothetical protein